MPRKLPESREKLLVELRRDPLYLLGDETLPLNPYERFEAPVLAYSFGDDDWGTPAAVDAMMGAYPRVERRHVEPAEVGLESIGHFGFFRPDARPLRQEAIDWMRRPVSFVSRPLGHTWNASAPSARRRIDWCSPDQVRTEGRQRARRVSAMVWSRYGV